VTIREPRPVRGFFFGLSTQAKQRGLFLLQLLNRTPSTSRRSAWNRFISAIQQHERQHRQHGIDAAHDIEKSIGSLEGRPTCDAVVEDVNALGHRIVREHAARDVEYDQRTHHGRDEGVHLP
jgi:predicted secreted Zn-dependent protease